MSQMVRLKREAEIARRLEAKKLTNPLSSEPQVLAEAMKDYKDHCAVCHAEDGGG
jgi:cytochrome c